MQSGVLGWPRAVKRLVVIVLDVVLALLATWIAFTLRLDEFHWPSGAQWWVYGIAPVLAIPVFVKFGLYRAIFRYTGQAALKATGQAVAVYGVVLLGVLLWRQWTDVPRSLGVLQPLVFLLLVGSSRALARFWLADLGNAQRKADGRLLIYGAGTAGVQTASALSISRQFILLGFVDDDAAKVGRSINGVPVFAATAVPDVVARLGVTDILLALPSASRDRRNRIIESLRSVPVHIRTLPGLADLATGRVTVQDFKELDIEDLLGRDPVPPNTELLARNLTGKVVLVTGAGGSIGSELCRQILAEKPRQLLLLDHNEFGLYSIHQELRGLCTAQGRGSELVPLLGSVANPRRLQHICQAYCPDIVYHAAAYKHVPLVESNSPEGVLNNVIGTLNMARAAMESGALHFVLVSTDKAVRPTNVMGATKRMAELVLQALAASPSLRFHFPDGTQSHEVRNKTVFAMVRFGNVLDSSGSVVPLFRKQLLDGGPLTVTHEEVTRYFMTIPEAAQLVLQAGAMAQGGDVFVLDMGQPVKIMDLALRMAQLAGLSLRDNRNPDGDIEIKITGLRPGEKLYEELLIGDDPQATVHDRIMKAHEDFLAWPQLEPLLTELWQAAIQSDETGIKNILMQLVHGYKPGSVGPLGTSVQI